MGDGQWAEIVWVLAATLILAFLLTQTRFGMRIIATGGNLLGAAEAGVPIRRVKVWAFVISAFFAGLIGIVDAVKYGTLDPGNEGVAYILYAVGACVIGGTALTGGRGTVIGAFIGAILLGVLQDGLTVIGVSTNAFYIWVGIVIVFAMALNVQFDRLDRQIEGQMTTEDNPSEGTPPTANGTPALEVRGVTKRFGALVVLRGIDLVLKPGEVLGLVGDNGAGKSTLVKILSGFYSQDDGEILIGGKPCELQLGRGRARRRDRDRLSGPGADPAAAGLPEPVPGPRADGRRTAARARQARDAQARAPVPR